METRREQIKRAKEQNEQFDQIEREAKEWVQHQFMGSRATQEANTHFKEVEASNGLVKELRLRFLDDLNLIASYLFNRERRNRQSQLVLPEERKGGGQFWDYRIGGTLKGSLTYVRSEIPEIRRHVQGDEPRDGEFYRVYA